MRCTLSPLQLLLLLLLLVLGAWPQVQRVEAAQGADLYSVLGVPRSATQQEIKRAYKTLARANHPDKSKEAGAQDRFVKINEAYEVLSDPKRRKEYDMFGTVQPEHQQSQHHHHTNGFRTFFHGSPFNFEFHQNAEYDGVEFQRITLRQYKLQVQPDSWQQPALLYAITDFCLLCLRANMLWQQLAKDLLPIGFKMAVVHAGMASNLAEQLRITEVPAVIGVINGIAYHHNGDLSIKSLRNFLRSLFPSDLFYELSDSNYKRFLLGWADNRPRALLAKPLDKPSFRFLLTAFKHRQRVASGFLDTSANQKRQRELRQRYDIGDDVETSLIFHEDPEIPASKLVSRSIDIGQLDRQFTSNIHLKLPRLSSQSRFAELCPAQINYRDKFLCVAYLLPISREADPAAAAFRAEAQRWTQQRERPRSDTRVRLVYAYPEAQLDFLRALGWPDQPVQHFQRRVVILWRATSQRIGYRWLDGSWPDKLTPEQLAEIINSVLEDSLGLAAAVSVPELIDEHRPALYIRIWQRLLSLYDRSARALYRATNGDPSGPMLIVASVVMVACTVTVMTKLAQWEEQKLRASKRRQQPQQRQQQNQQQQQKQQRRPTPWETAGRRPDNTQLLCELQPSNYRQLVSNSQRGRITLLLITSEDTQTLLAEQFARCIAPFASVDRLRFTLIDVGKHLNWYRTVLEFVIGRRIDSSGGRMIQPRNCAGTVLAINGFRKYFCIYHPKIKSAMRRWRRKGGDEDATHANGAGAGFLGLNDDSSSSSSSSGDEADEETGLGIRQRSPLQQQQQEQQQLLEKELLAGLPNWLDRLFDGQLPRIRVEDWPQLT